MATAALLASIPNITLSVAQKSISTIEPKNTNTEKPSISLIIALGNIENLGFRFNFLKQ